MRTTWLALIAAALLVPAAHAHPGDTPDPGQRSRDPSHVWRARVLGPEGRLHVDPNSDFEGTVGPRYVYKDGRWYTADMRWVYFEGGWVTPPVRVERVIQHDLRNIRTITAPEG